MNGGSGEWENVSSRQSGSNEINRNWKLIEIKNLATLHEILKKVSSGRKQSLKVICCYAASLIVIESFNVCITQ
jgi:hypothetical protein